MVFLHFSHGFPGLPLPFTEAWSFAVARQDGTAGTARAVAWTALQILPDFKAQGGRKFCRKGLSLC
jgi:hypothetical protein